jgi:Mg/Co/Ni transporter MgtE
MSPVDDPAREFAGEFALATKIADAAPLIYRADRPFAVVDDGGRLLGQVTRDQIVAVLMGQDVG